MMLPNRPFHIFVIELIEMVPTGRRVFSIGKESELPFFASRFQTF